MTQTTREAMRDFYATTDLDVTFHSAGCDDAEVKFGRLSYCANEFDGGHLHTGYLDGYLIVNDSWAETSAELIEAARAFFAEYGDLAAK